MTLPRLVLILAAGLLFTDYKFRTMCAGFAG
jgi:hypothetical protein